MKYNIDRELEYEINRIEYSNFFVEEKGKKEKSCVAQIPSVR